MREQLAIQLVCAWRDRGAVGIVRTVWGIWCVEIQDVKGFETARQTASGSMEMTDALMRMTFAVVILTDERNILLHLVGDLHHIQILKLESSSI